MFCAMSLGHVLSLASIIIKSRQPTYLIASLPLIVFYAAALIADAIIFGQFALYRRPAESAIAADVKKAEAGFASSLSGSPASHS